MEGESVGSSTEPSLTTSAAVIRALSSSSTAWEETTSSSVAETTAASQPLSWLKHTFVKDKTPLQALVEQADVRIIGDSVRTSDKYESLKMIGMTLFIPVDSAFDQLPFELSTITQNGVVKENPEAYNWTAVEPCLGCQSMRPHYSFKPTLGVSAAHAKIAKDLEDLILYHVVRRQVPPGMIEKKMKLNMRSEMNGSTLSIEYAMPGAGSGSQAGPSSAGYSSITGQQHKQLPASNAVPSVVIGSTGARVLEVVHCRNGFIYKLDRPLTPSFNVNAPTLMEYISNHPEYTRLKYLLLHSHLFDGWIGSAGPITVLLIKDDGWKINGIPVPDCFFKALVRPANRDMLLKILKWVTVPGIWRRGEIENSQWLLNTEAPALMVNHVYRLVDNTGKKALSNDGAHVFANGKYFGTVPPREPEIIITGEDGIGSEDGPEVFRGNGDLLILIEGKEVIEWNIPLHNGYAHVLSELPLRPDIDLTPVLWDCLDFLCSECPIVTKFALKFLDNGGLLPDVSNPKAYIVPNGIRPDWVCSNHRNWFPPGWELREWKKYIDAAKMNNYKQAQKLAKEGWFKAAAKREKLLDQYEEARQHLKRIWAHYHDPQSYVMGRKEDPTHLLGWLNSKRDLSMKPGICEPRDRMYKHRHGFSHQSNSIIVDDEDIGFSYDDWKYITQWI
ncbi:hypothetical protein GNI_125680 [Gregarina niphandrodes]|uniref:FAS1 domain-containing protein n=1 Tax=Gregarina niphandrodes TaxID=110365 RepID=A0A023B234_GRENI|nr:hypothetical protein GNI_125680 [Gregarina niphandrodes]EZG50577.1 hypothetical protein GNI_125680 [Gregarina niphandrodes]|eukprot:XP_011132006.1 hypothetical protein GNI_125680 [Gregarina niphandrodes]